MTEQEFADLLQTAKPIHVELLRQHPDTSAPYRAELAVREAQALIAEIVRVGAERT